MTEHILSAALTFALLAGGTIAVGSELVPHRGAQAPQMAAFTLPTVTVTGHRATTEFVAASERDAAGRSVQ